MILYIQRISKKRVSYILFFVSILIGILFIYACVNEVFHFSSAKPQHLNNYDKLERFIFDILLAPFIETFINQWLVYKIVSSYTENKIIIILISSIIFSLLHGLSYDRIFVTFFQGIFLMIAFIFWEGKTTSKYTITALIHLIYNFILFCLLLFVQK